MKNPSSSIDVAVSASMYGVGSAFQAASYHAPVLDGLTRYINQNVHKYDAVLITGDLSTTGDILDIDLSARFVSGQVMHPYNANAPKLELQNCPLILMPGNHDHYGVRATPSKSNFGLKFGPWLKNYDQTGVGHRVVTAQNGNSAYAFIFADFSFNQKTQANNRKHRYGGGKVHQNTLQSLEQRTHEVRRKIRSAGRDPVVVWMIHFAPYQCEKGYLEMTNYEKIVDTANRCDVLTILCGHTHHHQMVQRENVKIFCAGAATSVDCTNIIHELELDHKGVVSTQTDLRWDRLHGEFREPD